MIAPLLRKLQLLAAITFFAAAGCAASESTGEEELPGVPAESEPEAGASPPPGVAVSGSFVGEVEGADALIGLVADGLSVAALATDGASFLVVTRPTALNGHLGELAARRGGAFLGGIEFYEEGVRGELLIDGTPFSFEAAPATGEAGIRWESVEQGEAGWVTGNDGASKGLQLHDGSVRSAGPPQGPVLTSPAAEAFQVR